MVRGSTRMPTMPICFLVTLCSCASSSRKWGVAEHHRVTLAREVAGDVGCERGLADAAFGIRNDHDWHDGYLRVPPCAMLPVWMSKPKKNRKRRSCSPPTRTGGSRG